MKISKIQYNPVFSNLDEVDDVIEKWYDDKFKKTSLESRLAMSGETAEQEVQDICEKFGISDWQKIGHTAIIFRDIFCDRIREEEIKKRAIEKIGIKESDLPVFMELIKKAVGSMKRAGEKEYHELIDQLTLKEAVRKYPEIQGQEISEQKLLLNGEDYPVPGTVKNWLTDYFQRAGGNKHDSLKRGEYFFKAESAKELNSKEKDNLNVILKAFDDDSIVAINRENKEIDFVESKALDDGKDKLNGIMKSYDYDFKKNSESREESKRIENDEKKENFEKIKSTPHFEVDRDVEKRKKENSNNTISLKQERNESQNKDREKRVGRNKNNQNVLDLSDYV